MATEIDPSVPVPLPSIRHRTRTLRRRRATAIVSTAAAAVVLVVAVLPNAVNNSAPDPAKPPPDYTKHGITLPGAVDADRLAKAEVAEPGQQTLEFDWTPRTTGVTFRPLCRTTETRDQTVSVTINGRLVLNEACDDSGNTPRHAKSVPSDHALWIQAEPGKAARVRVFAQDQLTGDSDGSVSALALGIYRSADPPKEPAVAWLPIRGQATESGDYVRDGFRFPAKVAGDPLIKAVVGEAGEQKLTLSFTATGATTGLRPFCTANDVYFPNEFSLKVTINRKADDPVPCSGSRGDLAQEPRGPHRIATLPGQTVEVSLQVVDSEGKPSIGIPDLRIGVGGYDLTPHRSVNTSDGSVDLGEAIEYGGYTYKLATVQTASASTTREVTLDTPPDKPYVIAYGSENLDKVAARAKVVGLKQELHFDLGSGGPQGGPGRGGPGATYGQPAGPDGKVTLSVVSGQPTKGVLYLALYLPE